ncbi:hypothetical protein KUTeg_011039 [Tegillarca granosa]|uniref:Sodium-coupled monocarboxylate transporter 1 n=1 Tax=Tegillarca granosa TaxID=220873 RepID=A0ABQ9F2X8_TEGGR|nr:hypothetical protein KUTeg_011039 [Tegillarca granosa]
MENTLGILDWIVFTGLLVISTCIGIYHAFSGGRQKTTREFLVGNRELTLFPVAISILVSFQSAILILGAPAEMYTKGTQYYLYTYGQIFATFLASVIYVPLFYPLKLTSVNEYLELRFKSKAAKLVATFINISATIIYTGIASFAPSTALHAVSGFPEWISFIVIGSVCTFYTFMGGLKAVVWVDAFQGVIMLAGLIAIVAQGTISVGGFNKVWDLNKQCDKINFWNFDPDPTVRHTFWALVFGAMISWTGTYGASQQSIQRYSALPSMKQAKIAVLLNSVGVFLLITCACICGIVIFAYYANAGVDPLSNGAIRNSNQIIPYFVMEVLGYPGIPGLFIACLFSGALSSISSNYSSLCAMTWEDLLKPFLYNKSEQYKAWITRLIVVFYGVLGVGVAFLVKNLGGTVLQGLIAGGLSSYIVTMWIGFAKYSPTNPEDVEPKYLIPIFDRLCCCLPESVRRYLRCGARRTSYVKVCNSGESACSVGGDAQVTNGLMASKL